MKVGIDSVLQNIIKALKGNEITLFTFAKPENDYGCNVETKIPIKLPVGGIYQNAFMPQHNYNKMDVVISNSYVVKTKRPCMVYDQNQLGETIIGKLGDKYKKGFWKLYATPYKLMRKTARINQNARYYSISDYSSQALQQAIGVPVETLYPGIELGEKHENPKSDQICIMGRIAPEKNLEMAVEIANEYGGLTVLAGVVQKANEGYLKKLRDIANTNVMIVQNPSRQDFLKIMSESKIILSASKETLGLTQIEGIHYGCVPIVPDNSAHPETVPFQSLRYETIFDAVAKINRVMNNDNIRTTMVQGLQNNNTKFNFELFSKRLNNILKDMKTDG
jgi:glycosyltransferase involved in cell wall biosynthesis